jgi:hypothetical protein
MVKTSRYVLVLLGIMVTSIAVPDFFWTVFRKGATTPNVMYSQVLDDFIIVKRGEAGTIRVDPQGNHYTDKETEALLPMLFFRQLAADGNMPDSVKGVEMDHAVLSRNRGSYSFMPRNINTPAPLMWPLMEAKSGRVNLSMPRDFYRIKDRIEFVVAETNKVDQEKSKLFNDVLVAKGFAFPARLVAGIPTTLKSKDEGYFIKDNIGNLFHLKMIQGKPFVEKINIPDHINIIHIECVDMRTEEFYAYLYTDNNEVYVLMNEIYYLQKLPVEGFDRTKDRIRIRYDVFGKTISVIGDNFIKVTRVDDIYDIVDTYEESWEPRHERSDHRLFARIFPFELQMQMSDSRYVGFFVNYANGYAWLIVNLLLVAVAVWLLRRKKRDIKKNIIDLIIVLLAGIFGFIAIRIFPNKFYD